MKKFQPIALGACLAIVVSLATLDWSPFAEAETGQVYGPYTVTRAINSSPIQGSATPDNAPVYEMTSTSPTTLIVQSGYIVIVLNGVSRSAATSPLLFGLGANATIYLADDSVNTFTCTDTTTTAPGYRAGIAVVPGASLTIEGTGTLNATGGLYAAGIGGTYQNANASSVQPGHASGTITINSGTIKATGGAHGAGIGGALYGTSGAITINGGNVTAIAGVGGAGVGAGREAPGGTTVINGGIVNSTGGATYGGAGIGGGGNINAPNANAVLVTGNLPNTGGDISIHGGNVTATSQLGSAGIGSGFWGGGSVITITGGTINAKALSGGTGIGAGGRSFCDTITISGGDITASGTSQAAGIGNGTGVIGCDITITGGTIWATSAVSNASGIGGGADASGTSPGSATVIITGGNVYSGNSQQQIRVNTNPTNGKKYGSQSIYAIDVTLVDPAGANLPNAKVSIEVTAGYTYSATTNANGHAYIWLPAGDYPFLMTDSTAATYSDYQLTVVDPGSASYDAVKQTIQMVINSPVWTWAESDTTHKLYDTAQLNLTINHNNPCTNSGASQLAVCAGKAIAGVEWFRENVTNPANTIDTFTDGFKAAATADKGVGAVGKELSLQPGNTADLQNYQMTITKNGCYWVRLHVIGVNTGLDVYLVKSVKVTNIYTPVTVSVRDWHVNANSQLQPYTLLAPTTPDGHYGIPFDLDGAILGNVVLGYDTVTYQRSPSQPAPLWSMSVPGAPFASTPAGATTALITLDTKAVASGADPGSTATSLLYTVNYSSQNHFIVYDTNGGSGDSFAQDGGPGGVVDLSVLTLRITGIAPPDANLMFAGWNTAADGSGTEYQPGDIITVSDNLTLFAQWVRSTTTLTVSNTVSGALADKTRPFGFEIFLEGSTGPITASFACTDQAGLPCATGPVEVTNGHGAFELADGQSVTLMGVPLTAQVKVSVAQVPGWTASFIDSLNPGVVVHSNYVARQQVSDNQTFAFDNARYIPPNTGLEPANPGARLMLVSFIALLAVAIYLVATKRRRRQVTL